MLKGALNAMKKRMDPELYGGAPLLGVNGICIITHGASSSRGILHAIRVAGEAVQQRLNASIAEDIRKNRTEL
jgi:glycerol-3-phosphate acyltransferase PlsX